MISEQGGIFGSVSDSETFVKQLKTDAPTDQAASHGASENSFEVVETPASTSVPPPVPQPTSDSVIDAKPYKWPYNGNMTPQNTCIIVIDMQIDFCAK